LTIVGAKFSSSLTIDLFYVIGKQIKNEVRAKIVLNQRTNECMKEKINRERRGKERKRNEYIVQFDFSQWCFILTNKNLQFLFIYAFLTVENNPPLSETSINL
jgi:hypothetical protein